MDDRKSLYRAISEKILKRYHNEEYSPMYYFAYYEDCMDVDGRYTPDFCICELNFESWHNGEPIVTFDMDIDEGQPYRNIHIFTDQEVTNLMRQEIIIRSVDNGKDDN